MAIELTDAMLMRRYQDGDAAAFEILYGRYRGDVFRWFVRQTRPEIAEELYQEVWMRVIRSRERYQHSASFRTYLYTIAHHLLIDYIRSTSKWNEAPDCELDELEDAGMLPDILVQNDETAKALVTAIAQLPAPQREAFLLKEEAGLSLDEIAAVVGSPREAIKSRLRYATRKLRELLSEIYP